MRTSFRIFYEFGPFRLDPQKHRLLRDGEVVPLSPKALEALLVLVRNSGKLLEREQLMQALWADTFVEDANLTVAISHLRKTLGQNGETSEYIETVPRVGYRFVADVREVREEIAPLIIERRTLSHTVIEEEMLPEHHEERTETVVIRPAATMLPFPVSRGASLLGVAVLAVLGVGALFYFNRAEQPRRTVEIAAPSSIRSIAVLPFRSLNAGEPDGNYLGSGIADALITRLGSLEQISVRPTSAVMRFDGPNQDSLAAARSLGVDAVLEGSFQRDGDRLRVTAQLVGARDGAQIWAGTFDEKLTDIFTVQDSISEQAARALALKLSSEEHRRLRKRYTENPEAYQAYLKGRYFWNKRTADNLKKSVSFFHQALDLDPVYALAYAGLADSYLLLGVYGGLPVKEASRRGEAAAMRSLELDDTLAEAHASLGLMKNSFEGDYKGAEESFKRAIEINPNYATAHHWYALHLMSAARHGDAIVEVKRAAELDPLSLMINTDVGLVLSIARRYDEAVDQLLKTLELDPNFFEARHLLGQVYMFKRMYEEAIAEWRKIPNVSPSFQLYRKALLGYAYALSGKRDEALRTLDEVRTGQKWGGALLLYEAQTYACLGDKDEAFKALEKLSREEPRLLRGLKTYPLWDSVRTDPRFTELLRLAGLADG